MRIITGSAKGKRLITPDGRDVRPTPDRVKEGIFSALQFELEGRRVLDLFAGSGQLGIEALSRGAQSAVFVDSSASSVKIVRKNLEISGFEDKARVHQGDYSSFIAVTSDRFDIAFLDPPYASGLLEPALNAVAKVMSDYGVIVCEHPLEVELPEAVGDFKAVRRYRYGKVYVTCYRKEETA